MTDPFDIEPGPVQLEWDRLWKIHDDLYERACAEGRVLTRDERRAAEHAAAKTKQLDICAEFDDLYRQALTKSRTDALRSALAELEEQTHVHR